MEPEKFDNSLFDLLKTELLFHVASLEIDSHGRITFSLWTRTLDSWHDRTMPSRSSKPRDQDFTTARTEFRPRHNASMYVFEAITSRKARF